MPECSYDIFLSYSRKDGQEHAERLEHELALTGLKPWRDRRNLDPDQDFTAELEHGIEESARVLCCITPDTRRDKSFVRREIGYALAVNKPIIPLIFEDATPPIHIINVTHEDFTHVPWEQAFLSLLTRLRRGERFADQQVTPPADPFRRYVNALYRQIVDFLKHTVFSEIILYSEETEGAVGRSVRTALPAAFWHAASDGFLTGSTQSESFASFGEVFSKYEGRVLLLGDPGAGKTTTLLAFARDRVAARLHDPSMPLPLLAPISSWKPGTPLCDWLASQVSMLNREAIASQIAANNTLLMLDGLDELGRMRIDDDGKSFDPRQRFIANVPEEGPLIITCRVEDYASIGAKVGLNGAVTLKGLDDCQLREYLAEMPTLWQALEADQDLRDVVRTPLLLSILTRAYQENAAELSALRNLKAAPAGLRETIFQTYVRSRVAHEQRHVGAELPFAIEDVYRILGQAVIDGIDLATPISPDKGISTQISLTNRLGDQAPLFIEQMLRLHFLVREHSRGLIFIHLLLQDYFGLRFALAFVKSPEFEHRGKYQDEDYRFRQRTLQFLSESGDERALELLLPLIDVYISSFPLVHGLSSFADPRVLLAYARTLSKDIGLAKYDYLSDVARDEIKIVAEKLGASKSAQVLVSAIPSARSEERADYVFALGHLKLSEGFDAVIAATQDDDATVRGCAAHALAAIGNPKGTGALRQLLGDDGFVESTSPWQFGAQVKESVGAQVKDIASAALLEIVQRLGQQDPGNDWQRDLAVSHTNVGGILQTQHGFDGALRAYRAALEIRQRLAQQDPGNTQWQLDLAVSHGRIGDVLSGEDAALFEIEDLAGARAAYRTELAIAEPLVARHPRNIGQPFDITLVLSRLVAVSSRLQDFPETVRYSENLVSFLEQNHNKKVTIASALGNLSWYYLFNREFTKARSAAEKAHSLDNQQIIILTNLAHAEMFLGHLDAAMNIHAQHANDVIMLGDDSKSWRGAIADDFAVFRKAGLESPHMAAVERLMAAGDQD